MIDTYLNQIGNQKILTKEEEQKLAEIIQNGGPDAEKAVHRLVSCNLKFAYTIAREFVCYGFDIEDLVAEANIGLINAAEKFSTTYNTKFITYAIWYIRRRIFRFTEKFGRTIKLPLNKLITLRKLNNAKNTLSVNLGRDATDLELCEELGISLEEMENILKTNVNTVSLETPISSDGEGLVLGDTLCDTNAECPSATANEESTNQYILKRLKHLNKREQDIITNLYGLKNKTPMTFTDVAKKLGISRERIRQLEKKSLKKLRDIMSKTELADGKKADPLKQEYQECVFVVKDGKPFRLPLEYVRVTPHRITAGNNFSKTY